MNHKRLYVGDLPAEVTEAQIELLFSQVGKVETVTLNKTSKVQVFAFLEMATPEQARDAVRRYNGFDLEGCRLIVYTVPPRSRPRERTS